MCPAQRLRFHDTLFVRRGYQLDEFIRAGMFRGMPIFINARIVYFTDANPIESNMEIPSTETSCFKSKD